MVKIEDQAECSGNAARAPLPITVKDEVTMTLTLFWDIFCPILVFKSQDLNHHYLWEIYLILIMKKTFLW